MTPDRTSLAERIRRRRARIVTPSNSPREPATETSPGDVAWGCPPQPVPDVAESDAKAARLARARELIRRTERGWKELRVAGAENAETAPREARLATPAASFGSPGALDSPEAFDSFTGEDQPFVPGPDSPATSEAEEPFSREDHDFPLASRYGGADLLRLTEVSEQETARLQIRSGEAGVDLARALFLDTETSGLAGGTGTFAFLIGVGYVQEDRFRVTQFLMRNPLGEAAMLEELAVLAAGRRDLVTYNGGSFDLPLLETRFALNGVPSLFRGARHLDLLHPARRLFKPRHENARLATLEREVLEVERDDDIPGDRIPQVFFDFLRNGRHPAMESVLAHNRYDIVTLAALALRALERMADDWYSDDPADLHGAGHHFWRRGESEVAIPLLERALSAGLSGRNRDRCLLDLGERRKQLGDWTGAIELWRQVSTMDSRERLDVLVWFAKHEEHQRKDPAKALEHVEDAWNGYPGWRWAGRRPDATERTSKNAPPASGAIWTDPAGRGEGLPKFLQPPGRMAPSQGPHPGGDPPASMVALTAWNADLWSASRGSAKLAPITLRSASVRAAPSPAIVRDPSRIGSGAGFRRDPTGPVVADPSQGPDRQDHGASPLQP